MCAWVIWFVEFAYLQGKKDKFRIYSVYTVFDLWAYEWCNALLCAVRFVVNSWGGSQYYIVWRRHLVVAGKVECCADSWSNEDDFERYDWDVHGVRDCWFARIGFDLWHLFGKFLYFGGNSHWTFFRKQTYQIYNSCSYNITSNN